MLAKVLTGAVVRLDGALVEVEVDIAPGGCGTSECWGYSMARSNGPSRADTVRTVGIEFPKWRQTAPGSPSSCSLPLYWRDEPSRLPILPLRSFA